MIVLLREIVSFCEEDYIWFIFLHQKQQLFTIESEVAAIPREGLKKIWGVCLLGGGLLVALRGVFIFQWDG